MDLINRQEVIDTIKNADVCMAWNGEISAKDAAHIAVRATKRSIVDSVEDLPSAQPHIIHCKDCKYYGRLDKRRFYRGMDCLNKHIDTIVPDVDFCSKAERRDDG